jgi:hypothetical protein
VDASLQSSTPTTNASESHVQPPQKTRVSKNLLLDRRPPPGSSQKTLREPHNYQSQQPYRVGRIGSRDNSMRLLDAIQDQQHRMLKPTPQDSYTTSRAPTSAIRAFSASRAISNKALGQQLQRVGCSLTSMDSLRSSQPVKANL